MNSTFLSLPWSCDKSCVVADWKCVQLSESFIANIRKGFLHADRQLPHYVVPMIYLLTPLSLFLDIDWGGSLWQLFRNVHCYGRHRRS